MPSIMDEFEAEFGGAAEEEVAELDEVVEELSTEEVDQEFSEAEKRIMKATYYRAVARDGIIADDGTELAVEVNAEAKRWAGFMMRRLLNIQPPAPPKVPVPDLFTPKEAEALRRLAAVALVKMGEAPAAPQVRQIQPSAGPAVRQIQPQPAAPAKPAARPKAKPATQKPKPAAKPAATPAAKSAAQKPRAQANPTVPVGKAEWTYEDLPRGSEGKVLEDDIPSGQVFHAPDDGGAMHRYKFVDNKMYDPDKEGSRPRAKLCVDNQAAKGLRPKPPMSPQELQIMSEMQSRATIVSGRSANTIYPDQEGGQDIYAAGALAGFKS